MAASSYPSPLRPQTSHLVDAGGLVAVELAQARLTVVYRWMDLCKVEVKGDALCEHNHACNETSLTRQTRHAISATRHQPVASLPGLLEHESGPGRPHASRVVACALPREARWHLRRQRLGWAGKESSVRSVGLHYGHATACERILHVLERTVTIRTTAAAVWLCSTEPAQQKGQQHSLSCLVR